MAREGLSKISEFLTEPGFGATVDMLTAGIAHHVKEEEDELFPQLRERYDADRLESLGRTLVEQKRIAGILVRPYALKEELLELARVQGVEGRSGWRIWTTTSLGSICIWAYGRSPGGIQSLKR